jgi:hypothetical protein
MCFRVFHYSREAGRVTARGDRNVREHKDVLALGHMLRAPLVMERSKIVGGAGNYHRPRHYAIPNGQLRLIAQGMSSKGPAFSASNGPAVECLVRPAH